MSKLNDITKQKEKLERTKKELEEQAKSIDPQEIKKQYVEYYCDYFDKKTNTDIELLKRIPRFSIFADNNRPEITEHPLHKYGIYDIEALSILIKNLYSIHREGNYNALVFGHNYERMDYNYTDKWFISTPELYFLIGKEELLNDFRKLNGLFVDEDIARQIPSSYFRQKDLVVLQADGFSPYFGRKEDTPLELAKGCEYTDKHDSSRWKQPKYLSEKFSQTYSSIKNPSPWNTSHGDKRDYGLAFPISMKDAFIRDFIFSISLYRKNNGLSRSLTNEELSELFNELYGTNINISEEKVFTRKLTYTDKMI